MLRRFLIYTVKIYMLYFPINKGKVPVLMLLSKIGLFDNIEIISKFDNGIVAKFDIEDWVQQLVFFFGNYKYEYKEVLLWKKLTGNSSVIIDIGCNFGYYSLLAAKNNPEAIIYSFEPSLTTYEKFLSNVKANKFQNIIGNNIGLSDVPGDATLYVLDSKNSGMNSIGVPNESKALGGESIILKTLDSFVLERQIGNIDLIKIDVEGYELRVLKGCIDILKSQSPIIFLEIIESQLEMCGDKINELFRFLKEHGFLVCRINNKNILEIIETPRDIGLAICMQDSKKQFIDAILHDLF